MTGRAGWRAWLGIAQTQPGGLGQVASLGGRALLFVLGALLSTLCYAVTVRAAIGLGPLYAFQDGVARQTGMSLGDAVVVTLLFFLVVAVCMRARPGPGTLAQPFVSGGTLDWMVRHLPVVDGWGLRLGAVVVATVFMALGGACMFRAGLGVSSYTLVMLGLHRLTRRALAPLRIGMELTMLACGWLLGGAIGVGTLITGLLIGPGLQVWIRTLGGLPAHLTEGMRDAGDEAEGTLRPALDVGGEGGG